MILDLLYAAAIVGFFALMLAFIRSLERLGAPATPDERTHL
jgi:hypothetical protein